MTKKQNILLNLQIFAAFTTIFLFGLAVYDRTKKLQ